MAKLDGPVTLDIVRGFKGKLDFYGNRGVTYVRRWPRWSLPNSARSPAVQAQWPNFAAVRSNYRNTSVEFKAALSIMAETSRRTNIDVYHGLAYGNLLTWTPA